MATEGEITHSNICTLPILLWYLSLRQVEALLELPDASEHIASQIYTTVPPPRTTSPS